LIIVANLRCTLDSGAARSGIARRVGSNNIPSPWLPPLRRFVESRLYYYLSIHEAFFQIPSNISYDEAASIPVAIIAAYVGLYNRRPYGLGLDAPIIPSTVGKYSGNPIVVFGGSSSVGQSGMYIFSAL